jgi:hypothetical protein
MAAHSCRRHAADRRMRGTSFVHIRLGRVRASNFDQWNLKIEHKQPKTGRWKS